jgi:predicted aldo/keto reductase-like oxidoreductase
MNELLSVMEDLTLTPQEKADLKLEQAEPTTGMFCSQCEDCLPQCSAGVDIPTLMRSYMYAFGYNSPGKARETLDKVRLAKIHCVDCGSCTVKCSSGFDIKRKATDIARILEVPKEFLV